ncbi:MAG: hypothetical protein QUS11_01035 [Candidatus Fermentibacter sp.]|nr:hypothetical protein [Candidatus Fermentibacter sp.]
MPALLLVARIGRVPVVLPWFPVWMILLPLSWIAWMLTLPVPRFCRGRTLGLLRESPRLAFALARLHGTRIGVDSVEGARFSLAWV